MVYRGNSERLRIWCLKQMVLWRTGRRQGAEEGEGERQERKGGEESKVPESLNFPEFSYKNLKAVFPNAVLFRNFPQKVVFRNAYIYANKKVF